MAVAAPQLDHYTWCKPVMLTTFSLSTRKSLEGFQTQAIQHSRALAARQHESGNVCGPMTNKNRRTLKYTQVLAVPASQSAKLFDQGRRWSLRRESVKQTPLVGQGGQINRIRESGQSRRLRDTLTLVLSLTVSLFARVEVHVPFLPSKTVFQPIHLCCRNRSRRGDLSSVAVTS